MQQNTSYVEMSEGAPQSIPNANPQPRPDAKDEKHPVLDLDSKIKQSLQNAENFPRVSEQTRIDIINGIGIEMDALKEHPPMQVASALVYLCMTTPELNNYLHEGEGDARQAQRDIFAINLRDYDGCFAKMLSGGIDPFCTGDGGLAILAVILACAAFWATGRPYVRIHRTQECTTAKLAKVLLPLSMAAGFIYTIMRYCSASMGEYTYEHFDKNHNSTSGLQSQNVTTEINDHSNTDWYRFGAIAVPIILTWMICCSITNLLSYLNCRRWQREPEHSPDHIRRMNFLRTHPIEDSVLEAVRSSSIIRFLTEWQREGDNRQQVMQFGKKVINAWVDTIEKYQAPRMQAVNVSTCCPKVCCYGDGNANVLFANERLLPQNVPDEKAIVPIPEA